MMRWVTGVLTQINEIVIGKLGKVEKLIIINTFANVLCNIVTTWCIYQHITQDTGTYEG